MTEGDIDVVSTGSTELPSWQCCGMQQLLDTARCRLQLLVCTDCIVCVHSSPLKQAAWLCRLCMSHDSCGFLQVCQSLRQPLHSTAQHGITMQCKRCTMLTSHQVQVINTGMCVAVVGIGYFSTRSPVLLETQHLPVYKMQHIHTLRVWFCTCQRLVAACPLDLL